MSESQTITGTVALCSAADVSDGSIQSAVLPDGTRVALYNVGGRIYATVDLCTHGEASLSEEGTLEGTVVECGWHFGRFDVTTGAACGAPCTTPLRTYPVALIEGIVHVTV